MAKFIFVTGGVVSGLGKGITAASMGRLLKDRGYKVVLQKLDPYLNVDPGDMSPLQHGEVFVLEDGSETDLDLGHYERFNDVALDKHSAVTAGKIYSQLITRERRGDYEGGTVQVIPHVTNEIKARILALAKSSEADVVITEVGGTVGDIESLSFIEAIRQMRKEVGRQNVCYVHVTLLPYIAASKELKTKPTQHSVERLRSMGVLPDFLVCRSEHTLTDELKAKIALFCDVEVEEVLSMVDQKSVYEVPLALRDQHFDELLLDRLGLPITPRNNKCEWDAFVKRYQAREGTLKFSLAGSYVSLPDAYLSITEALIHAGVHHGVSIEVNYLNPDCLSSEELASELAKSDGIIIGGGLDEKATEGKIAVAGYAREHAIPYLGDCLGMQVALVDFARNVAGIKEANSEELNPEAAQKVVCKNGREGLGKESLRLGTHPMVIAEGTRAHKAYGSTEASERHRHRYEFCNPYREELEAKGLKISATSPDGHLVEMIELSDHPWFVCVQGQPEFKSRPTAPAPLFKDFIEAALLRRSE